MSDTPRTDALTMTQAHRDWGDPAKPVNHPEQIAEWRKLARQLETALRAILAEPYGCRFCDSGKLRDAKKAHESGCGYGVAEAVLAVPRKPMNP